MNWNAVWLACEFFTLGRVWSGMLETFHGAKWWQYMFLYVLVMSFWPLLWLAYGLDKLSQHWSWFDVKWRRWWGESE